MNDQIDFTSKSMQVKCPKRGTMAESQPAVASNYRKIIKCFGKKKVSLKKTTKEVACNFTGFVKIEKGGEDNV